MSLTRCLKKMGLSSHEAAILKGAAAEYREEGMQARDAAVMAVTDHAEQLLAERADVIAKVLKEAKARGVLADVQAALDAMPTFTRESVGIEEAANDDASAIDEAAHEAATSPKNDLPQPTDAQKDAGNYRLGHARLIGLDLSIENPAGSKRSGTDANGTAWSVTMRSHYGYIKGTVGKDKDHIDVFVKPGTPEDWTGPVFVIDQTKGNGHFDEHKILLGFETEAEARAAYLENYTKGWDRLRAITETTPAEFKAWLKEGDTTKAFAQRGEVKAEAPAPAVSPEVEAVSAPPPATPKPPKITKKVAAVAVDLAATLQAESRRRDFSASGLPLVLNFWAADAKVSADELRAGLLQVIETAEIDADKKRQIVGVLGGAVPEPAGRGRLSRAFHGSPARNIERFDTAFIGSGEGAQAYGWGLYFASRKEIAEHYRKGLSYRDIVREFREELPDDADLDEALAAAETMSPQRARVIRALAADDWLGFDYPAQAITAAFKELDNYDASQELRDAVNAAQGQLYEVEVPEDDVLLAWDLPLSGQPEKVRDALRGRELPNRSGQNILDLDPTGEEIYGALRREQGGDRDASEWLSEFGIKGIKYLDGGSRASGDGTHNYVIFSGDDAMIVRRLLSRTGQSPASRFQRASPEDIDAAVADLKRRLPGAPPIFVVKSTNDPRIGRSLARRMTAANAEGAYEGGRVYVVAPEMRSMEHVEGLLAHEVFHAALDLMGEEKSALLRSMQDGNAKLREDAAALRARYPDMGELESVEEVLADYAREGREPTLLQRWASFIRAVLRKVGLARIAKGWTDGEVLGLVADAPRRAFAKRRDAGIRMYVDGRLMRAAPIFYSKMADEIARKGSTGTGAEWKARLAAWVKAGAVKADEVEWSGVTEWLGTREGKVTSEEVLEFLRENGVRVEEVVLSDSKNETALPAGWRVVEQPPEETFRFAVVDEDGEVMGAGSTPGIAISDAWDPDTRSDMPVRYANYQLPGGTNYREVLLTLPQKTPNETTAVVDMEVGDDYDSWAVTVTRPDGTTAVYRFPTEISEDDAIERGFALDAQNDAGRGFKPTYKSPHWDAPNVLAHIRLNDRTDSEGRRVLFVEEIQSDWAQDGRKRGFSDPNIKPVNNREFNRFLDGLLDEYIQQQVASGVDRRTAERAGIHMNILDLAALVGRQEEYRVMRAGRDLDASGAALIPSAPFVTKTESWTALALKRVIRMAAEEGYDAVAFVTGAQSAERYDLSKQVRSIDWKPYGDGNKIVTIYPAGGNAIEFLVTPEAQTRSLSGGLSGNEFTGKALSDVVGKEIAEKIMQDRSGDLSGDGLKVGGEGMRAFYDKIVPNVAKDVLKKVGGGSMGVVQIGDGAAYAPWNGMVDGRVEVGFDTRSGAQRWMEHMPERRTIQPAATLSQPGFLITPAMREKAMAGLPLFTRQGDGNEDVYRTVGGGRARSGFPEATRIRGADGRPGTTYRGATRELSGADFALDALGRASGNPSSGLGVWFAADEGIAARYGEVAPFHLDIRNPLVVRPETIPGFDSVEEAHRFRERARKKGHDGIIVDARHLGGPVYYVAFDAEQAVYPRETSGASLSRVNQNLAQPLSEARYTEQDQARAAEVLSRRRGSQALDALVRVPMQALRLDKVTATVIDGVLEKLGSLASTVAPQAWERAKAGLVDQYGLPQDVKDQRSAMQGRMRAGVRSSKHAIDALANLTRAESRVLYEYVNGDRSRADLLKAGLPEESVRIIDLYQRVADEMGQEAVRLGQLSADAFEAHRWAYVHRSYQKHVLEMPEQAKVERSRALKVRGDQYQGRGMSQAVPMKAIQNVAPAWWGRKTQDGKADKGLRGEAFIRFDRRAAVGEGTADLEGFGPLGRRGRILETHYWPAGEPVPAMYGAWERDAAPWTARDTKGANLLLARDFTQAERQAMGEVDEIRYGMAATLHRMIHDVEVGRMLEYLAVNHGKTDETLPQGANLATDTGRMMSMTRAYTPDEWVLVPESKIPGTSARAYGALAGMYVPGPIWNDVRQIVNTNVYPLGETYADLLRAWKLSKTALSLPVHMNNVMSNVLMADFHDVGVKDVLAALEVIRHQDRPENALVLERFEDAGGSEGLYNLTELQKETIQPLIDQLRAEVDAIDPAQGLTRVSSIVTLITQMRFREAFSLAAQSRAGKSGAFVRDKLVKAYENEDLVFRLAAFIRAKGDGSSDVEAGRQARQSFLDYQINAPWINLMRSTAFPFISFTYRALPMMLHTAKTKPWKIAKWGGIMGLLNLIGYAVSGGDEDKERRLLPEEVAGRTILGSPKLLRAPWNDEHGSPVFLDVRRWIPVGDIVDWGQTHSVVPFFPQLMPSGPAGLFAELALNKSAFTGKEITQQTDTAAEMAGKVADYLYKAFAPNTPGVPFAYSTEKILGAGSGKTDAFGREQSVVQAAASSVGVKLAAYPTDVLQRNAVIQFRARDAEIKANVAKLQRELQRKGIDPEEFEAKVQRQNEKRIELATELAKKMGQQ